MPLPTKKNRPVRRLGLTLAALVILFGLMTATVREPLQRSPAEWAGAPFRALAGWVNARARSFHDAVADLTRLQAENATLREQVRSQAQAT